MRNITTAVAIGLLTGALMSCTPVATYPPDNRTMGPDSVVNEPVPSLIAEAVLYSSSAYGVTEEPVINLPPGTGTRLYDRVIAKLGEGKPQTDADELAFSVTKVRCRALDGEVDIFIPAADGTYRFATLFFEADPFMPFHHVRTRWWDTGEMPPPPGYGVTPSMEPASEPEVTQPVLAHD